MNSTVFVSPPTSALYDQIHEDLGISRLSPSDNELPKSRAILGFRDYVSALPGHLDSCLTSNESRHQEYKDLLQGIVGDSVNRTDLIYDVSIVTRDFFGPYIDDFIQLMKESPETLLLDKAELGIYGKILVEHMNTTRAREVKILRSRFPEEEVPFEFLRESIKFGVWNTARAAWSIFDVIPRMNSQHGVDSLSSTEWASIAAESKKIILTLSSGQISLFDEFDDLMRRVFHFAFCTAPFQPEDFTLKESGKLELSHEFMTLAAPILEIRKGIGFLKTAIPRIGCPAYELIGYIFDWSHQNAETSLFQDQARLLALPAGDIRKIDNITPGKRASEFPLEFS